ncbi:hypothetical protein NC652_000644 [Populus alba x Populus x berolinensis]|nr:hypothetical protein NC652_000644 [Populus alba x Populus x berolinensis]
MPDSRQAWIGKASIDYGGCQGSNGVGGASGRNCDDNGGDFDGGQDQCGGGNNAFDLLDMLKPVTATNVMQVSTTDPISVRTL